MPVDEPARLPFSPVKARSNTRGTSPAGTPQPSSATSSTVRASLVPAPSSRTEKRSVLAPYFPAFATSWPMTKASHFTSANTRTSSSTSTVGATPRSMRKRACFRSASRTASARLVSRMA